MRLEDSLLAWFDANRRALPWRDAPCGKRDPYRVWLAEVMLQQTQVAAVIPYYETFLSLWPDVGSLAAADDDAVMKAWAGLGYYARARNLLKCAREVAGPKGGEFPETAAELEKLPGVGAYTSAAISSIAYNEAVPAVDGNVMRVVARLDAIAVAMPAGRDQVAARVAGLIPKDRAGDFTEALMELGAAVCRPRSPDCGACPWQAGCKACASGTPENWPRKLPKKEKPTRRGWALWVEDADGRVLLVKRPDKGLLGGMAALPVTEWAEAPLSPADGLAAAREIAPWADAFEALGEIVHHTFTHFHLELGVIRARAMDGTLPNSLEGAFWAGASGVMQEALPNVMKKAAQLVIKA